MEGKHKKVLQKCTVYLIQNLSEVEAICDHLVVDGILTQGQNNSIKTKKPAPRAHISELLSLLPRRGPNAYHSFLKALDETENTDAAEYLREHDGSKSTTVDTQVAKQQHTEQPEEKHKLQSQNKQDWPNLSKRFALVKIDDIAKCTEKEFTTKCGSREEKIYPMKNVKRGKFIMISNAECISKDTESKCDVEMKKAATYSQQCITNSDFDKSNIGQLFKCMGYDSKVGNLVNKPKEEIKEFLKKTLSEIDKDPSSQYDSLVIMFVSGKNDSDASKIYDASGDEVPTTDILEIIKACHHFEGKPKVVFIHTYNLEEELDMFDSTDSSVNNIIKNCEPNNDDIFVVSSYPRTGQGPWVVGENMNGSYFIQGLIHVFKNSACEKSFIELLNEVNACLLQAVVPKLTEDGKIKTVEKKPVAQIVVSEYCEEKELYFFPGFVQKAIEK
ncbi:Hypothetical predicted protein [Mytilus galloprovincialis]|uniref:CARD domain-containing protein n=1 Tax=Mytilus galloprovincialis TaxID=29158 RepID=A0A8B6EUF7_MYTGA|nr:Hypothetical predicted protein [Mytilus galloprovincialis]